MNFLRHISLWIVCSTTLFAQNQFSQNNALQLLKHLCVDIGPRPMGSPAEQRALQFAIGKFKEYGCDTSYLMPMERTSRANTNSGIAIGIKRGTTGRIILVGGHIDSAGPEIPGADDDGSGAATVMEAARVLCQQRRQSTLVFCCFGGEEAGIEGSKYFVDHFPEIDSVAFMVQVDMANGLGVIDLDADTHGQNAPQWLVRAAIEEFSKLGYRHLRYPTHFFSMNYATEVGSGSDHEAFLDHGIPAIDFSTDVSKPIHTPRDNFENFEPGGLKRSGDVAINIVNRFDTGTPNRQTEHYWLYLIWQTPIFIPFWALRIFVALTIILSVIAFISVRRRKAPDTPDRPRWQTVKMFLFSIIIVLFAWFSSDLLGIVRGLRHPWYTATDLFIVLAILAGWIGVWVTLQLRGVLRVSDCPYVFFKRAVIILIIGLICSGILNIKLTVEPSVSLLLLSLAILAHKPVIKFLLVLLSPLWMMRLIFSEWSDIPFKLFGSINTAGLGRTILYNGGMILFFSLYLLPVLFSFAAVVNDSLLLKSKVPALASRGSLILAIVSFLGLSWYLISMPVYNNLWYRDVRIEEIFTMDQHAQETTLRSSEYLSDVHMKSADLDTTIHARTPFLRMIPLGRMDTTWAVIKRNEGKRQEGDTTRCNVQIALSCMRRPLSVSVTYSAGGKKLGEFSSPFKTNGDEKTAHIEWNSYPDSNLIIPVQFAVVGNDSISEKIEIVFDTFAYPMELQQELTYFIPRTKYIDNYVYRR